MKNNIARRVVAGAAITGAAVMGVATMGDGVAAAGKLPGGTVNKTLVDGTPVNIQLFDQYVNVQRAVTNVATSREVWLSGKVKVKVGGSAKGGTIKVGYDVGCQVNFGASAGAGGGVTGTVQDPGNAGLDEKNLPGGSGSVTLGPGQVTRVWVVNETSGDNTAYEDYNTSSYKFSGKVGGVVYSQEKFGVDGCAGYASARPVVQVTVSTDSVKGVTVFNGKPFSLG
ncbi:MspA family porin [Gordonia sp. ABSL1-1]|uniref:MspA family porin n=1 Tax=Gordonia sp. ABSL1-1 TaxID=3053923 RepID=UPI00257389C4|nr:MspA family porin [Gordonia sp. ABSL1-1]MDL9938963.1 MspA family porin [Gordonia sp. ABSL1-1]